MFGSGLCKKSQKGNAGQDGFFLARVCLCFVFFTLVLASRNWIAHAVLSLGLI